RLLPTTLSAWALAFKPESPAENDPTAIAAFPFCRGRLARSYRCLCRVFRLVVHGLRQAVGGGREELLDRRDRLVDAGELFERAELGELRDELGVRLRLRGVLVLQLHDQQLQKRVVAESLGALVRRRDRVGGRRSCRLNRINAHVPSLAPSRASRISAW